MANLRLGDIDFNRKPVSPKLYLCRPNKTIISIMNEASEIQYSQKLGSLNELTFRLPFYLDVRHKLTRNANADTIKGRYLVKLVLGALEEYFIINQIEKVGNNEEYIDVKSLSLGFELNDKIIRNYEVQSYTASQLLTDLLKDSIWKIGYVDSEFDLKYRQFSVTSSTVLELVFEVGKTFNALVVWDTLNREISLYMPENVGIDRGFTVKYGKYLEGLNQEDNTEEVITRLKMYGKEDISIRAINPTGTTYIEDFNYFIYPYSETTSYTKTAFTSTTVIANWSNNGASTDWIADSGNVKLTVNDPSIKIIYNPSDIGLKNYKVSANIHGYTESNGYGIVFRYQDSDSYYYVIYDSSGLGYSPNNVKLFKVEGGVTTELANSDSKIIGWSTLDGFKLMSVEVDNNLIKVWIDNHLVISFLDDTFASGTYGLCGLNQHFEAKDIVLENKEYTITNFSEFMSPELCHHIIAYDKLLQDNKTAFETLRGQMKVYQDQLDILNGELFDLQTDMKILLDERDILNTRIARKQDAIDKASNHLDPTTDLSNEYLALVTERDDKLIEISNKQTEIDNKNAIITTANANLDSVENNINLLRVLIDVKNTFPQWLIEERNQFIIEKEWQDSNIETPEDLLKEGQKVFEEYKQQKITLKVDVVNFLSMITEQRNWDKLNLGDEFNIEHERLQVKYKAKLTEIDYNFEDDSISIQISNVKDLYSNKDKFLEMLYKSYSTSTQVSMRDWEWDLALENKGSINEIINNAWNANKQKIIGAKDQVVEISDRGLIIRNEQEPNKYLVAINGILAVTDDGGQTFKHAITTDGIVGERIYGKVIMGVNLAIEDEHGIVKWQGSKGEIFDRTGQLVMKLGLVEEAGVCGEAFGMISFNDVTQVKVTDCEGFVINRANTNSPTGWEKIFWAEPTNGTLYAHDLVTSDIKIVSNQDWNNVILNAETGYLNIGFFENIVKDGKLTTDEKLQIITELNKIYSNYKSLLSQASKYQRVRRDDTVNINGAYDTTLESFPTVSSTVDRFSTVALSNAYTGLIEYIKTYVKVTSVSPHDPLTISVTDPLNELTQSVLPDRQTFILKFKTYYDEATKLGHAIEDAIAYQGLTMGENYNNVFMGEYGFIAVRDDGKYRAFLNATNGLALQKWNGTAWENKLYASIGDPDYNDGTLIAEDLVARRLKIIGKAGELLIDGDEGVLDLTKFKTIIGQLKAENISADIITANNGFINDLAVNKLITIDKTTDTASEIRYIKIENEHAKWIHGENYRDTTEQMTDSKGRLMYWTDSTKEYKTINVTAYPIMVKTYDEKTILDIYFDDFGGDYPLQVPVLKFGGDYTDNMGQALIYSGFGDGLHLKYNTVWGTHTHEVNLAETGIILKTGSSSPVQVINTALYISASETNPLNPDGILDAGDFIASTNGGIYIPKDGDGIYNRYAGTSNLSARWKFDDNNYLLQSPDYFSVVSGNSSETWDTRNRLRLYRDDIFTDEFNFSLYGKTNLIVGGTAEIGNIINGYQTKIEAPRITLYVDANNYISITSSGINIVGSRVNIN